MLHPSRNILRHLCTQLRQLQTAVNRADPYPPPFKVIVLRYISSTHHRKILSILKFWGWKIWGSKKIKEGGRLSDMSHRMGE